MKTLSLSFAVVLSVSLLACGPTRATVTPDNMESEPMAPPMAKQVPHRLEAHGQVREDEFYWLRSDDRSDAEMLSYLEAENSYTDEQLRPLAPFQETLFQEIVGRIAQDDSTVPYRFRGDYHYVRYEEGEEYPIFCRRRGAEDADEEVLLDANAAAEGHEFFQVARTGLSESRNLLAYAEDTVGRRIYTIRIKDLATGDNRDDVLEGTSGGFVWAADDQHLFYVKREEGTLRAYQVWRHVLGTAQSEDALVFEETDDEFFVSIRRSKSQQYVIVASYQTLSHEIRVIPAAEPLAEPRVFLSREENHEYDIDHLGDRFYIRTNWEARDFRLMSVGLEDSQDKARWREEVAAREGVFFGDFDLFTRHLVVSERRDAIARLRIIPWADRDAAHEVSFDEAVYHTSLGTNREADSDSLRFRYASLTTPTTVYDYDMGARTRVLKKQDPVLGDFDSADYVTGREVVTARDGTRVPVSFVHRRDLDRSQPQPLLLYGYGSYGYSIDPTFRSSRLSLLDRGVIFAIAHIRGGQDYGRAWYEDGKMMNKMNTFTDFIDCGRHLVEHGWTRSESMFAMGGSAGGLLMGAVVNMDPDLFTGVVASVPFVDVVTTMLDETIPLTTFEYDEWGNPNERAAYDYMMTYSPYDNVTAQDYPNMLVLSGLHDSQVQYWEPTKWVARLRVRGTGDNRLLLHTNMDAGHGGASGRFRRHRETAMEFAFLLDLVDVRQ